MWSSNDDTYASIAPSSRSKRSTSAASSRKRKTSSSSCPTAPARVDAAVTFSSAAKARNSKSRSAIKRLILVSVSCKAFSVAVPSSEQGAPRTSCRDNSATTDVASLVLLRSSTASSTGWDGGGLATVDIAICPASFAGGAKEPCVTRELARILAASLGDWTSVCPVITEMGCAKRSSPCSGACGATSEPPLSDAAAAAATCAATGRVANLPTRRPEAEAVDRAGLGTWRSEAANWKRPHNEDGNRRAVFLSSTSFRHIFNLPSRLQAVPTSASGSLVRFSAPCALSCPPAPNTAPCFSKYPRPSASDRKEHWSIGDIRARLVLKA
mmetsp:Transcript_38494/g.106080  ORF Transcript_38494/g.106080 Transcript_38494/m.106080 type:complete len:326 (-) Transcript_38494:7-984(-)